MGGQYKYAIGITMIAVGIFGMIGSLTGNLAPMIAALFAPEYLVAPNNNAPYVPPALGGVELPGLGVYGSGQPALGGQPSLGSGGLPTLGTGGIPSIGPGGVLELPA